jgi:flagellar hook-associated protein 1 FlgK
MTTELTQTKFDTGVSLKSAISDVNSLTKQLADLNVRISSSETSKQQQNDLRDTRDNILKDLGGYVDINYFESASGAYTVMMSDGHTLVSNNEAWSLDWTDTELQYVNVQSSGQVTRASLGSSAALGGKIGGLMEINNQLIEGDPDNYLGRLNALSNSLIREVNQQASQGVGLISFSDMLTSAELANNATCLSTTVDPLACDDTLAAGSLKINDRSIGRIDKAENSFGVAMGKTANAVTAINEASAGVLAKLTTLVAGGAVDTAATLAIGNTLNFTINGVTVSYPVVAGDVGAPATLASHLATAINTAITSDPTIPKITIEAVVGTGDIGPGSNGGALNSIILRNTTPGDESSITISDLNSAPATTIDKIGLTAGTYNADKDHNTGELTLFSHNGPITIDGGADDSKIEQLGWDNLIVDDNQGDGQLSFDYTDGGVANSLMGLDYADTLQTDGGSFNLYLYNSDGSLALAQPVTISLTRANTLDDVKDAINSSLSTATKGKTWLTASVVANQLVLTPDGSHDFAFGNDTSNFLAAMGVNTFFSGHDANTIGINQTVSDNLDYLTAGKVNEFGEIFKGDNSNALSITNIQRDENIKFIGRGSKTDTLDGFYNSLIAEIGLKGKSVDSDLEYNKLVYDQLSEIRDSTSGVSLDEEMANLIKFQHAYSAAAKLISTSDEMLQTLLATIR